MKILCIGTIISIVFFLITDYAIAYSARGHSLYKREANPDPKPGLSSYVGNFCNATMINATSHEEFCQAVGRKVVEKVNVACKSAVKTVCKVFVGKPKTKAKCKKWLYENLCPTTPDIAPLDYEPVHVELAPYEAS